MRKSPKKDQGEKKKQEFDETLRRMLETPPKPKRKDKGRGHSEEMEN